jgi:hypothetical protein
MKPMKTKNPKALSYSIGLANHGGGIRGKSQLMVMKELERRLPKPLWHYFDFMALVSAGAIDGVTIASGKINCSQALEIYDKDGGKIFNKNIFRYLSLFRPKYSRKGLDSALEDVLGDMKFGDMKTNVLVLSVETTEEVKYTVFKSAKEEHKNFLARNIVGKSASAPTYFAPDRSEGRIDIDGGMAENNPSLVVLSEMINKTEADKFVVVSIGTGKRPIILPKKHTGWGKLGWVTKIIDVCLQQNSMVTDYCMNTIANKKNSWLEYFEFNTPLVTASSDMDDASENNLKKLHEDTHLYLTSPEIVEKLNKLAELLIDLRP